MNRICAVVVVAVVAAGCGSVAGDDAGVHSRSDSGARFIRRTVLSGPDDAGADFAANVAISGDGKTLAVGTAYAGLVYVYALNGTEWELQSTLSVDAKWGGFGRGLSVNEDGSVIAVTADFESLDGGAAEDGAIYTFKRTGTAWAQDGHISNPAPASETDHFGTSVSVSRDGAELAIAGPGVAHVYERASTGWEPQSILPSVRAPLLSGDGHRLLLGASNTAPLADGGSMPANTAVVFEKAGMTWTQQKELAYPTPNLFESNMAINRDGSAVVLCAATNEEGAIAYLYEQQGATWALGGSFQTSTAAGYFNSTLAVTDDASRVALSLPTATSPDDGGFVGAVWVYTRNGSDWASQRLDPLAGDTLLFGRSLAMSGDGSTLAIVAPPVSFTGLDGHVYVFTTW